MKIGILTLQYADNYGAVLQAYALRRYLLDQNIGEIDIINYCSDILKNIYSINPLFSHGLKGKIKSLIKYNQRVKIYHNFNSFRKFYLGIDNNRINEIPYSDYDIIIVGSDQVWNLNITKNDMNYFLKEKVFYNNVKAVAFAASADDGFPSDKFTKEIQKYLLEFSSISVRENNLALIIHDFFGLECDTVCDPVLLLKKEHWLSLMRKPSVVSKEYGLIYLLKRNASLDSIANKIADKKQLDLFSIHPTGTRLCSSAKLVKDAGPLEFLYLIKNAEFIVSNSFHAFVFALLFSKEIYFEYIEGSSNRIGNLVKMLDIPVEKVGKRIYHTKLNQYNLTPFKNYVQFSVDFIYRNIIN